MDNKIKLNFEEIPNFSNNNNTNILLDLFEKNIIDVETFTELYNEEEINNYNEKEFLNFISNLDLDKYNNDEEDEEDEEEYDYIYEVNFTTNEEIHFYYKDAKNTHWSFDIPETNVQYIKVSKSSPEYQTAFFNSKISSSEIKKNALNNNKIIQNV